MTMEMLLTTPHQAIGPAQAGGGGVVCSRRFTLADQEAFALFSGDWNPIHLDPVAARRTQAATVVVHGVHSMLWALEQIARTRPLAGLCVIAARFNRFIYVDAVVDLRLTVKGDALVAEIFTDGQAATTVKLEWGEPKSGALFAGVTSAAPAHLGPTPNAPSFDAMALLGGHIALSENALASAQFPTLSAAFGPAAVAAIAAATGVVGMLCPGLHSLFSQLTLRRVSGRDAASLQWRTKSTDARARWVILEMNGAGWEGEAICLARQEPVQSRSIAELSQLVRADEFAGRRALVIGGSRGLGAVTAKLLAAGGGHVEVTYARGAQDAEDVAQDIRAAFGDGACAVRQFDVTADKRPALEGIGRITHLYYFATPRITRHKAQDYDRKVLDEFLSVYVDGFAGVWDALAEHRPLAVLYPSTIFLDQRPRGMTEYLMAKAAAEQLCADLSRRKDVSIMAPRIPRVLTDQTATLPPVPTEDPVEVMLPLLRGQTSG
jgi:acyl dehydratase/NAD(P)-dependent dehydrogenase (short-subunit alcohol dehydrogenase family)